MNDFFILSQIKKKQMKNKNSSSKKTFSQNTVLFFQLPTNIELVESVFSISS